MACTTILVGKNASYDGSTMIARNDDGFFDVKKLVVVKPSEQPKKYKGVISHLEIELPDNPLQYTSTPSVDKTYGIWAANGINALNVAMTATETLTTNPRVLGADPYVKYQKGVQPGGIGEEDLVVLVLPYIKSAREGVLRLGELLEKYGTYEANGIAFSDENEIWWLETIGGHHYIARKVDDNECVIMPNQFGLDRFDFEDAYGEGKENLCSKDLKEFIINNHLALDLNATFNPRLAFGSHSDKDHIYNTPRAWFMGRCLNRGLGFEEENARYTPKSDDIPWSLKPDRKITPDDIKYILSSYYQDTKYSLYQKGDNNEKGIFRPIGISRTGVMAILQIRGYMPDKLKAIEWLSYGCNAFNCSLALYANVDYFPSYVSNVSLTVSTDNLYWSSRIIAALADPHFASSIIHIERYQEIVAAKSYEILNKYDKKIFELGDYSLLYEANKELVKMAKNETDKALSNVLLDASVKMKTSFNRTDN